MGAVTTPVDGFTGEVAGVKFVDGKGNTDDPRALAYFKRHGYGIGSKKPAPTEEDLPDPRDLVDDRVGTELRDAAVDPEPEDFLGPTNAGEANPHGPDVVNPEIHASEGVRPIKGGEVHVGESAKQDQSETAHTAEVQADGVAATAVEVPADGTTEVTVAGDQPAKSAIKPEWVAFAVASGLDQATAEAMTKDELIAAYGAEG